jgi:hypothetical protein
MSRDVPHFLLTYGTPRRLVGVVIMEAPSMFQARMNSVARRIAAGVPFGECHELSAKMRLVEGRDRPEK